MNLVVATDGTLPIAETVSTVTRWHRDGDSVVVFTAVHFPSEFLRHLGEKGGVADVASIAREAGAANIGFASGAVVAERMAPPIKHNAASRETNPIVKTLRWTAENRLNPIATSLKEEGVDVSLRWSASDARPARSILAQLKSSSADLLIIGSHGHGRFEGLLGSTGTKLIRHAPCQVLVIPSRRSNE